MANDKLQNLQLKLDPQFELDVIEFFDGMRKTDKHSAIIQALRMLMRTTGYYEKQLIHAKLRDSPPPLAPEKTPRLSPVPVQVVSDEVPGEVDFNEMEDLAKAF